MACARALPRRILSIQSADLGSCGTAGGGIDRPAARGVKVRHRIGALCQRAVHPAVARAAAPSRTPLVAIDDVLVLHDRQLHGHRGSQSGRRGIFPLCAEAFHGRRDTLRRQRQLVQAHREVRRRELVSGSGGRAPHSPLGPGIRPPHKARAYLRGRVVLLGGHPRPAARRDAHGGRHPRRLHQDDAPRHAVERHALHGRQLVGDHDPEQPVLRAAHRGIGRQAALRTLFRRRNPAVDLHPRAPSVGRRGRHGADGTQRGHIRLGELLGRAFGPAVPRPLCRQGTKGLHPVPRLAHAAELHLPPHVRQRQAVDSGPARGVELHTVVQDAVRADAPIDGDHARPPRHTQRQGLQNDVLLRLGPRFDGLRRIRAGRGHRRPPQPRGLRGGARQGRFRRLLGNLGRGVHAIYGRDALRGAAAILLDDVHSLVAPPLRHTRTLRGAAPRGAHGQPQVRGLRRRGVPPILRPLRRRGVVPQYGLRLRGRPCVEREVLRSVPPLARRLPHLRIHLRA